MLDLYACVSGAVSAGATLIPFSLRSINQGAAGRGALPLHSSKLFAVRRYTIAKFKYIFIDNIDVFAYISLHYLFYFIQQVLVVMVRSYVDKCTM